MELGSARRERSRIGVAFGAIGLVGAATGAAGVILPTQIADYGVDKITIGWVFFAFSAGYVASAVGNGALAHRFGVRAHLGVGAGVFLVAATLMALRPSFAVLVGLQVAFGFGNGVLDAALNAYLSTARGNTALLNYFHAFFGVGALVGPILAAGLLARGQAWTSVYAVLAVCAAVLLVAVLGLFPGRSIAGRGGARPRVSTALRHRAAWFAAGFLGVYVGLEASIGNWGFSFLTEDRGVTALTAGWLISGYWLGLTLGRFVLNAFAERVGVGVVGLSTWCVGGVAVTAAVVWVVPGVSAVGLPLLAFFLGPIFPVTIAVVPRLFPADLVATVIGVLVAVSIAGGAAFSWLVGVAAQRAGWWSLFPIMLGLVAVLAGLGWPIARRLRSPGQGLRQGPGPASGHSQTTVVGIDTGRMGEG